jgi:uncharacterized membrane protein
LAKMLVFCTFAHAAVLWLSIGFFSVVLSDILIPVLPQSGDTNNA